MCSWAMGQIPRSTERISCQNNYYHLFVIIIYYHLLSFAFDVSLRRSSELLTVSTTSHILVSWSSCMRRVIVIISLFHRHYLLYILLAFYLPILFVKTSTVCFIKGPLKKNKIVPRILPVFYDIALWRHFRVLIVLTSFFHAITNAQKPSLVMQNTAVLPICY